MACLSICLLACLSVCLFVCLALVRAALYCMLLCMVLLIWNGLIDSLVFLLCKVFAWSKCFRTRRLSTRVYVHVLFTYYPQRLLFVAFLVESVDWYTQYICSMNATSSITVAWARVGCIFGIYILSVPFKARHVDMHIYRTPLNK